MVDIKAIVCLYISRETEIEKKGEIEGIAVKKTGV